MRYLTAVEAAKRIGVTERTIRLWVEQGKLPADHAPNNRLAIPESEVERIAKERGQSDTPDVATLALKILELEQRIVTLESQLDAKNEETPSKRPYNRKQEDLPPGCILATEFARRHGVNPITFRDHILVGLGRGEKEKVEAEERPKPGREKEIERYLTPEQQTAALAFWKRHGVQYKDEEVSSEEVA